MTDKEIIRALRLCSCESSTRNCPTCPLSGNDDCVTDALRVAADIIERLTAENAEAEAERDALREKVPQWVSVEDTERLPLPGTRVIATDGVFVGEAYRGKLGEWRRYDDCLCWFDVARQAVTHWVPLPEAPEEKHESV